MNDLSSTGIDFFNKFTITINIKTLAEVNRNGSIKNLGELNADIERKKRRKMKIDSIKRLFERLEKLGEELEDKYGEYIDPIEYFMQLYYGNELSTRDINNSLGFYKSDSGLRKLFIVTFGWKLREKNEETPIRRTKIDKHLGKVNASRSQELSDYKSKLISWFIKNSKQIQNHEFNLEYFNSLKNKRLKTIYLLKIFYGINNDGIKKLKETGIGNRIIANFLNEKLNDIFENFGIGRFIITHNEVKLILLNDNQIITQNTIDNHQPKNSNTGNIGKLDDFYKMIIKLQNKNRKAKLLKTFEKLEELGTALTNHFGKSTDPIEYFIDLYYNKLISIEDIFKEISTIFKIYEQYSGLVRLFRDIFGWKLRKKTQKTQSRIKKEERVTKERRDFRKQEIEYHRKTFSNWYNKNMKNIANPNFNGVLYNSFKNKREKTKYLLETFYGLGNEALIELRGIGLGKRMATKFINEKLSKIFEKFKIIPFEITQPEFSILLNKDL